MNLQQEETLKNLSPSFQQMAKIGGWEMDVATLVTFWTDEVYQIYGIPVGTPTHRVNEISFYAKDDQQRVLDHVNQCIAGKSYCGDFEFKDALGNRKWVRAMGEPVFDSQRTVIKIRGTFQDITEHKKEINDLNEKSKQVEQFFSLALDMLAIAGMDGTFKKVNKAFTDILGYTDTELYSKPFVEFIHPDDVTNTLNEIEKLSKGEKTINFENRYRCKDSSYKVISWNTSPDQSTGLLYAAARDITAFRKNEAELKKTKLQMEEAQKVAKIGSWSFDLSTGSVQWSQQLFAMTEIKPSDQAPSLELQLKTIHPGDHELFLRSVDECIKEGKSYKFRYRRNVSSEKNVWFEATGQSVKDDHGKITGLHGTCQDVTELVNAEELAKMEKAKTVQNAKLASLGEMSAGVAHEINNPLSIISGNAALLSKLASNPEKLNNSINAIQKASDRIAKIVNGLRKFSRTSGQSMSLKNSLNNIILESISMTEAKVKREFVTLSFEPSCELDVMCNEIELEQVFVNLINNSVDAIKNNKEKWIQITLSEIHDHAVVQVRDSGHGIPQQVEKNIFQPFFTTKSVGEGTGLGLSISKGILDDLGASIEILKNEMNTCFEIKIKRVKK